MSEHASLRLKISPLHSLFFDISLLFYSLKVSSVLKLNSTQIANCTIEYWMQLNHAQIFTVCADPDRRTDFQVLYTPTIRMSAHAHVLNIFKWEQNQKIAEK